MNHDIKRKESVVINFLIIIQENDKKSYTVPAAISELEKITIVKNSKDLYIRRYGLTKKQKNILGQFNVTKSCINKLAQNMNERI